MPRVTVLTAVHNGAGLIEETIASILSQTYEDFEYLIVDDGSTDGTAALVQSLADRDPRLRLIRRESAGGPFVAANKGLREARGELIVRTDADDLSRPQRIARQVAFLETHPELSACATLTRALDDTSPVEVVPLTSGSIRWALCLGCILVHSSLCIRRAELERRGGYRPLALAQDYRLFCELSRADSIAVVPELLLEFRRPPRRVSNVRRSEQKRHSLDILDEHLHEVTGEKWPLVEVEALYAVGRMQPHRVLSAMQALDRWDRGWRSDTSLERNEQRELMRRSALRRRAFLLRNAKRDPFGLIVHLRALLMALAFET